MVRFDGREMIFVSDRPGGHGALDLWVSTRDSAEERWSVPVNLTRGQLRGRGNCIPIFRRTPDPVLLQAGTGRRPILGS